MSCIDKIPLTICSGFGLEQAKMPRVGSRFKNRAIPDARAWKHNENQIEEMKMVMHRSRNSRDGGM